MRRLQISRHRAAAPVATHKRIARCEEVDCPHYLHGWKTVVGSESPQALYIRLNSQRRFEQHGTGNGETTFTFFAGQQCFREHLVPNGREAIFTKQVSGNEAQVLPSPETWRDDFAEELESLQQTRLRHG
jgi:hypothetical protein